MKWAGLFRAEQRVLDARGLRFFHAWIREKVEINQPLNEFVRDLLASRGSIYTNAPANFTAPTAPRCCGSRPRRRSS